jgi:hypothetical protein
MLKNIYTCPIYKKPNAFISCLRLDIYASIMIFFFYNDNDMHYREPIPIFIYYKLFLKFSMVSEY